jgi:hypothetical protein
LLIFTNAQAQIALKNERLNITTKGWNIYAVLADSDYILMEAKEIAELYGRDAVVNCKSRIEIHTDNDPDELFYNEQLILIEALYQIPKIHIFDPFLGQFLN